MTRHNLPHAAHSAPLRQNVTTKSSKVEQPNQLAGVPPRALILACSLDQEVSTAEEELALKV